LPLAGRVILADHARVMATALILAGAVAKGAFEAGVLSVIAKQRFEIASLVATSAGALNATLYAAGLRYRRAPLGAEVLHDLWLNKATWGRIVRPSLRGIFGGRGLSSAAGLEAVLSDGLSRVVPSSLSELRDPAPVSLTLVATSLNGAVRPNGNSRATSFEHAVSFDGSVFDTQSGRHRVCRAALASAALPILFEPVELPDVGPSIDGGIVNNTPISHAIDAGIERVIVITGNPLEAENRRTFRCLDLVGQAADIAVNERLFRDLLQARKVNDKLDRLAEALNAAGASAAQLAAVNGALGWKKLEVIEIRPETPLQGNAFDALGSRQLRAEYLDLGVRAAQRALAGAGVGSKPRESEALPTFSPADTGFAASDR
jgi:NTE family protein